MKIILDIKYLILYNRIVQEREKIIEEIKKQCLDLSVYYGPFVEYTINVNTKVPNATLDVKVKKL